jgi:hypothetical protein
MDFEPHVGENAELYAVGALDEAERAAVDAHIAGCAECLRRVGEAEETVLALERGADSASQRSHRPALSPIVARLVPIWWVPLAAAAALIIGMLVPRSAPQSDRAMLAMIGSHFSHAQFAGSGPPAKVLYARDRSWYYVIVSGAHHYRVFGRRDGKQSFLGVTAPRGKTNELFVNRPARYDVIELRRGVTTLESAQIR